MIILRRTIRNLFLHSQTLSPKRMNGMIISIKIHERLWKTL